MSLYTLLKNRLLTLLVNKRFFLQNIHTDIHIQKLNITVVNRVIHTVHRQQITYPHFLSPSQPLY